MRYGCSGCHGGNGIGGAQATSAVQAPPLTGLYGGPVPLEDGSIVTADESYIRDCILLPEKRRVAGYPPILSLIHIFQPKQKVYSPLVGPAKTPLDTVEFLESPAPPPNVTLALLERGQDRYRIYCTPCHSELGDGRGMICLLYTSRCV